MICIPGFFAARDVALRASGIGLPDSVTHANTPHLRRRGCCLCVDDDLEVESLVNQLDRHITDARDARQGAILPKC